MGADSDVNSGPGWYEVIHPTRAGGGMMRRWAVDPDYSPETRPADTYQLVYADDRSEIIAANLFHAEASEIAAAHNAEVSARPDVQGRCPACGRESLFLGAGGYVTCREDNCPRPDAASDEVVDYTPTDEEVRGKFATVLDATAGWRWSQEWAEAFDRWLARVKAEAWDEGNRHESEYLMTFGQFSPTPRNPYEATYELAGDTDE